MSDRDVLFRIGLANHPDTQAKLNELKTAVQKTMQSVDASMQRVGVTASQVARDIPTQIGAGYEDQLKRLKELESSIGGGRFGQTGAPGQQSPPSFSPTAPRPNVPVSPPAQPRTPTPRAPSTPTEPSEDQLLANLGTQVEALRKAREEDDRLQASLSSNFRQIASKAEEGASGIAQLASGVAFLFADSEDAKVLIDTLLTIKGTADIATGGFKTLSGGAQVISLLKDRTVALSTQQQIQTQQTKLTQQATLAYVNLLEREGIELLDVTNGNKLHAKALKDVAAQAKQAAAAEEALSRAQTKADRARAAGAGIGLGGAPRGRGRGRAALGDALGAAGLSAANGGGLTGFAASAGGALLGSGLVAGGEAVAGGTAVGSAVSAIAAAAGPIAAGAAAIAGVGAAATVLTETLNGSATKVDSWNNYIASMEVSAVSWVGTLTGAFDLIGSSATAAAETARTKSSVAGIQRQLNNELESQSIGSQRAQSDAARGRRSKLRSLGVDTGSLSAGRAANLNSADAANELAKVQKTIVDYQQGRNSNEQLYLASLQRAADLSSELVTSQQSQISAIQAEGRERQQINQDAIKAARTRIGLLDQEFQRQQDIGKSAKESLLSSAQRFAQLSQKDQGEALRAQQLAQRGRATELTDSQRDLLSRVGTKDATAAVRRADLAEARKGGFFKTFGGSERSEIQDSLRQRSNLQQQRAQVQAEIVDRREFEINIQDNTQQLAKQVIGRIQTQLDARDRRLLKLVEQGAQARRAEATAAANVAAQQRRNSSSQ